MVQEKGRRGRRSSIYFDFTQGMETGTGNDLGLGTNGGLLLGSFALMESFRIKLSSHCFHLSWYNLASVEEDMASQRNQHLIAFQLSVVR